MPDFLGIGKKAPKPGGGKGGNGSRGKGKKDEKGSGGKGKKDEKGSGGKGKKDEKGWTWKKGVYQNAQTGKTRTYKNKVSYLSFQAARTFVQSLKLTTTAEWLDYLKTPARAPNIPPNPYKTYVEAQWCISRATVMATVMTFPFFPIAPFFPFLRYFFPFPPVSSYFLVSPFLSPCPPLPPSQPPYKVPRRRVGQHAGLACGISTEVSLIHRRTITRALNEAGGREGV